MQEREEEERGYFRLLKKLKLRRSKNYKIEPHLTCDRKTRANYKEFERNKSKIKKKILNSILKCKYVIKIEIILHFYKGF